MRSGRIYKLVSEFVIILLLLAKFSIIPTILSFKKKKKFFKFKRFFKY